MVQMSKSIVFAAGIMLHLLRVRASPYSLSCDKRQSFHWQQSTSRSLDIYLFLHIFIYAEDKINAECAVYDEKN